MRTLFLTFIAFFVVSITVLGQTMEGTYTNTWESSSGGALTYTLTLQPDGTFMFVSHRVYESDYPSKTVTTSGTWKRRHRLLLLSSSPLSADSNFEMELDNQKARFKFYSPRHRKHNTVKPHFKFYKSEVFHAKGMKLFKKEVDAIATNN